MTESQRRFAETAVRRRRLFLATAGIGVAIGLALGGHTAVRKVRDPQAPVAARAVIVVLVLLNARRALREARYAEVLEAVLPRAEAVDRS